MTGPMGSPVPSLMTSTPPEGGLVPPISQMAVPEVRKGDFRRRGGFI